MLAGNAGALAHGQAVRTVLLQLLCDGDAICAAFQAALTTATASPEFAALEAARGGAAVDVAGNVVPERRLRAVAAELDEGLIVGAGSALERILQVRLCDALMDPRACACSVAFAAGMCCSCDAM